MARLLKLTIKEREAELKQLLKEKPTYLHHRIRMLQLIKRGKIQTKDGLAEALQVSPSTVHAWRSKYGQGGLSLLLEDRRGGKKAAAISGASYRALEKRLHSPKEGFRSYVELQQWLKEEYGISMGYHAVNKYVKRKFNVRLKAGRKSHVLKNEVLVEDFKKTGERTRTH
jgi:transposase